MYQLLLCIPIMDKEKRTKVALQKFQNNEITVSKASKVAGVPLTLFLDILYKRGINFHYNLGEFNDDTADLE